MFELRIQVAQQPFSQQGIFCLSDRRMAKDHTQSDIGEMMGWSREKVAQYIQLEKISSIVWEKIVTVFENMVTSDKDNAVTGVVTVVTFTERLLRNLLPFIENGLLVGIATTP